MKTKQIKEIGLSTKMEFAIAIHHNLNKQIQPKHWTTTTATTTIGNDNNSLLTLQTSNTNTNKNEIINDGMEWNENIYMQNSFALLFRLFVSYRNGFRSFRGWLVIDNNKFPYRIVRGWLASCDSRVGSKKWNFFVTKRKKKEEITENELKRNVFDLIVM